MPFLTCTFPRGSLSAIPAQSPFGRKLMKKLWISTALFVALLANIHSAAAFSTDQGANQNSDGSPKFADPDEQMPGFMVAPDEVRARTGTLSFGSSPVTAPTQGEYDSGAKAFDQAFSRQQNKE